VRWPGKSSGAFAFALTFLVLFLSRKKEQQSATTKKQRPNNKPSIVTPIKTYGNTKEQNQNISCLSGFVNDAGWAGNNPGSTFFIRFQKELSLPYTFDIKTYLHF
jgi:hypothetical protein